MYYPEVEWPGASDAIGAVARLAVDAGVDRLVLLSARNQDEAVRCEEAVTGLPVEWTIVAPASFNQNFDEGVFLEPLRHGVLALPAGDNADPFIDADDIADVVVAALTEDGHVGERYELTGPRLWTFAEGVAEIARATVASSATSRSPGSSSPTPSSTTVPRASSPSRWPRSSPSSSTAGTARWPTASSVP